MPARAAAKGLPALEADAISLPVPDESCDAVAMVSMLHLVPGWRRALSEARRVLRPGGRLAITRENLDVHWVWSYFPKGRARILSEHQSVAEIAGELPGARRPDLEVEDLRRRHGDGTVIGCEKKRS